MVVQTVHARLDVSLRCGRSIRRRRPEGCSGGRQRKTSHVLRDAHAYMLISIPTATSTIFGAFQVMLSSFQLGRRHVCIPTIACAWWAHLSTRSRRRNCDQGSRRERPSGVRGADQSVVKSISKQHESPVRFTFFRANDLLVGQNSCGAQSSIGDSGVTRATSLFV
jgi:hypothetical protein